MARNNNPLLNTGVGAKNAWSTGRKPKIYDCYGVLEKSAWIWRIVGIFPVTLKGPIGMKKYHLNKFHAAYGSLIFIACIGNCIHGVIVYSAFMSKHGTVSVAFVTAWVRALASVLCMFVASIWRIFRHKEISEIIDTIVGQDLILEKMNCCLQYESNARIIRGYVWSMTMTVVILMGYDFYASRLEHNSFLIEWLCWITPLVAQILDLTIFVSLVGLLGLKFRALNEKISAVVVRANASSPKIIETADVCAENLRRIAKAHYNICALGRRICHFFNVDVIINVITAFIILSTTLYYIFVEVQKEGETNFVRIGTYIHWEFVHSVPIIILVAICNWTSHQSVLTGKLIHEIRVAKVDSALYEIVKTFSLQLHHQKIQFSAAGFFPLNSTLIQKMVGHITTYLVILIQFQPQVDRYG